MNPGVAAGDVMVALSLLAESIDTPVDIERLTDALAGRHMQLDRDDDALAFQRVITRCDVPFAWTELRLRDAGRRRPCLLAPRRAPGVVVVTSYRFGVHTVRVIRGGRTEVRRVTTHELSRMLGVSGAGAAVRGLVASPQLPLEPLRDDEAGPWRRARALLGLERADIRLTFVYGIAIGILSVVTPVAVQAIVNTIALGAVLDPLVVLTVLVAIVLTFAGVMRLLHTQVVEAIQARMFIRATADITRRLFAASPAALRGASPAELTARFLEVPVLQKAVAILLVDGIDLLLRLGVGIVLLAIYHPMLLVFSVAMLVALVVVVLACGRGALATALNESNAKYATVGWLEETVRLAGVIRTQAGRRRALEHADQLARKYRDARRAHFGKLARTLAGGVAIQVIGSAALLGLGGALVVAGQLTLGQLVAAELVFASIALALGKLHKQLEAVYDVVASSKKFSGLVEIDMERRGGEPLRGDGGLRIDLTSAVIAHGDRDVLRDVSLSIQPGERVAIDAAPGTGKSTLVDALASLHPLTAGQLRYDAHDVRYLSLADLRSLIVTVRGADLATDTIESNLRYARPDAEVADLEDVLATVELADAIGRLPAGLATELAGDGRPLSETAARRLVLARALLARPRLLVVDGGLDNLGLPAEAKARVLDAVFRARTMTMLVVSNDPDVLARCDRRLCIAGTQLMEAA